MLTKACDHSFGVSVDNLSGEATDPLPFKRAVLQRVETLQRDGLSFRAETLRQALAQFYGTPLEFGDVTFRIDEL